MKAPIRDALGNIPIPMSWVTWFETVDNFIRSGSSSGTTANRPTKNLFVGLSYMDDDLGKQIQIKSLNPTVWVDSAGDDPDVPAVASPSSVSAFVSSAGYTSIPAGRQSLVLRSSDKQCVDITTQTQVRCIFTTQGIVNSAVTLGMSYDTTSLPIADNSAATTELTSGYVFDPVSTYSQADSGWVDLASGVSGVIFPNFWTDGNSGAESALIYNATFMFK
jgi:hypothetical protein